MLVRGFRTKARMESVVAAGGGGGHLESPGPCPAPVWISNHLDFVDHGYVYLLCCAHHLDGARGMLGPGNYLLLLACSNRRHQQWIRP